MGITEGTLLGVLTIASLVFVWAAIRERDKQIEQEEHNLYSRSAEKLDDEQDALPADRSQDEAQQ